jgi:microsomal dipeptidase-like Zn-dependent dipeptidase
VRNLERNFTDEQLEEILKGMGVVTKAFYPAAVALHNHPFIEFCGLMNEYISMCATTKAEGIDFTMANTHTGRSLIAHDFQVEYLAEKFDCIFGPLFQDKAKRAVFMGTLGWT